MEAQAKLVDASRSLDGTLRMTFEALAPAEELDNLKGKLLRLTVKLWKNRRSLDSNAYFHKLVNLIARQKGCSDAEEKNRLIREYGQYDYDENGKIPTIYVKPEYAEKIINMPEVHFRVIENGLDEVRLAMMRGSHTYDTKEMSQLIDGAIYEAREAGVPESEILTPDELAKMEALWKPKA